MTRTMADSDNAASLPEGMDLYAAYVDGQAVPGQSGSYAAACVRFGVSKCISISVDGDSPAHFDDVERGALTIQQAIVRGMPGNYCSLANWPANVAAYRAANKRQPLWWVAGYSTPPDPTIPPGAVGHQYTDGTGAFDTSVMVDYLPGIDPAPKPVPTLPKEKAMIYAVAYPGSGWYLYAPDDNPLLVLVGDAPPGVTQVVLGNQASFNTFAAAVAAQQAAFAAKP